MTIWTAIGVSAALFACAAILARQYIEGYFDRPLDDLDPLSDEWTSWGGRR